MQCKKLIPAALALALAATTTAGAANLSANPIRVQTAGPSVTQLHKWCEWYGFSFCGQGNCPSKNQGQETTPNVTPDTTPDTTPDSDSTTETQTGSTTESTQSSSVTQGDFASQVVQLVNAERAKAGLNALKTDTKVQQAAQVRAQEQAQSFSHTRPNGTSCFTALKEAGVSYQGAGENIAYGQKTPQEVMNGWMNSASHRQNILNAQFTTIGVGYAVVNGTPYWTQMFTY